MREKVRKLSRVSTWDRFVFLSIWYLFRTSTEECQTWHRWWRKNLMEAMHEEMTLRETTWPILFKNIGDVFNVDENSHVGHMKAVQQNMLDGTWKWSVKLAITARKNLLEDIAANRPNLVLVINAQALISKGKYAVSHAIHLHVSVEVNARRKVPLYHGQWRE